MRTIYVIGIIALLSVAMILAVMPVSAQPTAESVGVEDATGRSGTYVEVPVNITNVRNGSVLGVGFNIAYDKSVINIMDVSKGNLVSNWSEPNFNNFAWGTKITIAGFHAADAIQNGTSGSVVMVNFSVIGGAPYKTDMNISGIQLSDPEGTLGTARAKKGAFWVIKNVTTETAPPGLTEIDARDVADTNVSINTTTPVNVTVANYLGNPGAGFTGDIEKYIDVHINRTEGVDELIIKLFYTDADIDGLDESTLSMMWWNGENWMPCSNTGVNTTDQDGYRGYIWAYINETTTPSLNNLTGTPFGGISSPLASPVAVPEYNLFGLFALIGLLSVVIVISIKRRS